MQIPGWKILSAYGKNKFVQRTYVFLFVIPFLINTLKTYKLTSIIEAIPFSWHLFFYSAVFFSAGTLLYYICAPSIIKENKSFADFLIESKNWDHISKYLEELNLPVNEYIKAVEAFIKQHQLYNLSSSSFSIFLEEIDKEYHEKYKFLFKYFDKQRATYPATDIRSENEVVEFDKYKYYSEKHDFFVCFSFL